MAAIVIFMTLLAVVVFAVTATMFQDKECTDKEADFRAYWQNVRAKQGRMSAARRR
ncbi:MAG: hypothetical protein MUD08_18530 [Cytophagales bacterium]|jgi:hypothetical protein|nr:hypothetical protein [Cytophagales bacterium]